jgi:hypothetical protein
VPEGAVQGTVPKGYENWGSLSPFELTELLEAATKQLQLWIEEAALDEAAYHRKFWSVWQQLDPSMSIAALNRECECQCRDLQGELVIKQALREAQRVRVESLRAALAARR